MTFAKPTDTPGQPLNVIYAEHILQLIGVLTGQIDGGALQFLGQVAAPATAPTVTLSAGALNGSYEWRTYWITGAADGTSSYAVTGRTTASPHSAAQTLANQQGTVSIAGQAVPTGVVGWGVVRNQAGGGTWYEVPGSEQFMNNVGVMPTSFVDNVGDGNLVTDAPATNTTGTSLSGAIDALTLAGLSVGDFVRTDANAPNPQTIQNEITFAGGIANVSLNAGTDLNTVLTSGFYRINNNNANAPSGVDYGQLIVSRGSDTILQIVTGFNSSDMFFRVGNPAPIGAGTWTSWYEMYNSGSSSVSFPGSVTAATDITSSAGTLGSASGTWTPASGTFNVAQGTVINVAPVPSGAKTLIAQSTNGINTNFTWIGGMSSNGFFGMNLDAGQSYGRTFWTTGISTITIGGAGVTMQIADGSYYTYGYFQINGGYLQFVTTANGASNTNPAENVRWAVS